MIRPCIVSTIVLAQFLLIGCGSRDDFALSFDDLEFDHRMSVAFQTNGVRPLASLSSNDVIVAVNGYPLRKYVYDDLMDLKMKGILESSRETSNIVVEKMMEEYRRNYISNFVGQRILFDECFRLGLVTTNEVLSSMTERLKKQAKKRGKTVEETLNKYGDKRRYFLQELYTSIVMNKLINECIPPKVEVTPDFVELVQKQIAADNEAAEVTNKMLKARLVDWKAQIITNKLEFTTVAQRFSESPDPQGVWGEFEEGTMDDPRVESKAFALQLNAISDVVEDDNGYYLIKVLGIKPAEKNADGRVIQREVRKLSRIYFEKIPLSIRETNIQMTHDLKNQMQVQAINDYITKIATNGTTRIEYPNGKPSL